VTLTLDQIDALLTAGSLAPSGGNTQPWQATVQGKVIELRLDPTRGSVVLDPCADAAVMALGSFAENVALAASAIGLRTTTDVHVDESRGPVVRIELEADRSVMRDELFDVIATRSTNRRPHAGSPIPDAILGRLRAACASRCGHELLAVSGRDQKHAVADILAKADRVRVHNPALHHEMFSELRWSATAATDTCDGIDVRSLHLPAPGRLLLRLARSRLVARHFMPAGLLESLSRGLLVRSSHLCTLVMPMPRAPLSWFEGGRTLQRVWLTAERHGLAVQPWTVLPFLARHTACPRAQSMSDDERHEIGQLADRLRAAFGVGENNHPFFVFRLFTTPRATKPAARRPWRTFTDVQGPDAGRFGAGSAADAGSRHE
jgi:hypothetical protein